MGTNCANFTIPDGVAMTTAANSEIRDSLNDKLEVLLRRRVVAARAFSSCRMSGLDYEGILTGVCVAVITENERQHELLVKIHSLQPKYS